MNEERIDVSRRTARPDGSSAPPRPRKAWRFAFALAAGILSSAWAVIPRTDLLLRSDQELAGLRTLFSDSDAWREIRRLASRYAIRRIVSNIEDAREGSPGTSAIVYRFEVGSGLEASRRTIVQPYRVTLAAGGPASVEAQRGWHAAEGAATAEPLACPGAAELDALRAVITDGPADGSSGAYGALLECLGSHEIQAVVVRREDGESTPLGFADYRVEFILDEGVAGPTASLRFRARRDRVEGVVTVVEGPES